ncbi:ubiE/COQ5 methyltransferase [Xylariales sp. PMI_506]|nr:ubiE/COQ5 methyltransferase [Xylariales sp. PMI_506]
MAKEQATYSHGHHSSVVSSHARRTAKDSLGFLLPYIKPTDRVLDVGCGPGSITIDIAEIACQGSVIGVDSVASVLDQARSLAAQRGATNIEFQGPVDANALPYEDETFDVVFCHQVLQHVNDPIGILREMRRVVKPGGYVAARESDYGSFAWYPAHEQLDKWSQVYHKNAKANGGEPDAGRFIHAWARKAGFETEAIENTVTSWCYSGPRAAQWAEMWADRALHSGFHKTAIDKKHASEEEIQAISNGWRNWAAMEDLWFSVPSSELLYIKPIAE